MSPDITDELERLHAHGATASVFIEYKVALEKKCVELAAEVARLTKELEKYKPGPCTCERCTGIKDPYAEGK